MNILVVDDNETNLYQLQILLGGNGYQVITAANGAEALEKARQNPPDLIITDILMPVMDGFALCREWMKDERLKGIPFVFYTATYTDVRDREFALSLGAAQFITKPQDPEDFIRTIRKIIADHKGGSLRPARTPVAEEGVYLTQYNETLIRKLEAKMVQLEQAYRELRKLNEELEERVQERTAKLEATNKELEAFIYSASHDLRAPLRAIDAYVHLLQRDLGPHLDAKGKDVCSIISDNIRNMSRLIDDLLAFARIGRTEMRSSPVDMASLANTIFQELTTPESRGKIDFHVGPLPRALGDAALLREVWMNLLDNAIKFSSKKEHVVIEVDAEQPGDRVVYSVRDNGAGFDMQHAAKLFGVFQRLHSAEEFKGTGVGLAIVQSIVLRHGGRVWAEGAPDKGAKFYFSLKRAG